MKATSPACGDVVEEILHHTLSYVYARFDE